MKSRKIGPCNIVQQINDNAYEVELLEGWKINNSFNVSDLYEFQGSNEDNTESKKSWDVDESLMEIMSKEERKKKKVPTEIQDEQEIRACKEVYCRYLVEGRGLPIHKATLMQEAYILEAFTDLLPKYLHLKQDL